MQKYIIICESVYNNESSYSICIINSDGSYRRVARIIDPDDFDEIYGDIGHIFIMPKDDYNA